MNRRNIPAPVLSKLVELDEQTEYLTRKVSETEGGIADARRRLSGGFEKQVEYDDLSASLKQLVADKSILECKLRAAQYTLSSCKAWINQLPDGTVLEPVDVKVNGHDLEEVRARLKDAQDELKALRAVPRPSADIEERVRAYVREMARPDITGVGSGERLKVIWPGAGWDSSGPREHRADVLPMMALLHGDAMVAALMQEVERMADEPLPRAERKRRIAALDAELVELARVEEVLVAAALAHGEPVERSPSAPPQAVLGVRVAETKATRAA